MAKNDQLVRLERDFLLQGMFCNSDLFYQIGANKVLLCSGQVLNNDMLLRIREICDKGGAIYVSAATYTNLMEQQQVFEDMNQKTGKRLYEVTKEFNNIINDCTAGKRLDVKQLVPIVDELSSFSQAGQVTFLLQWVGYMRDMNEYLQSHSTNVAMLNGLFAGWLGMTEAQCRKAVIIGLLHDLGKTKIPPEILDKPGRLTDEEFAVIKKHPVYSCEILRQSSLLDEELLAGVRGHHEKTNGMGYPDGLVLEQISTYARITAVSDIYDAMVAKRCYKEANSPFDILYEFYTEKFYALDMNIVNTMLKNMRTELMGKKVILSDGRIATVTFIDGDHFNYPFVETSDGQIFQTNPDIKCVSLCTRTGVV